MHLNKRFYFQRKNDPYALASLVSFAVRKMPYKDQPATLPTGSIAVSISLRTTGTSDKVTSIALFSLGLVKTVTWMSEYCSPLYPTIFSFILEISQCLLIWLLNFRKHFYNKNYRCKTYTIQHFLSQLFCFREAHSNRNSGHSKIILSF